MNQPEIVLTQHSKKRIEEELRELRAVKLSEVNTALHQTRDLDDPGDNGDYQSLCLAHAILNGRIIRMEALLEQAKVVDESLLCDNTVKVGATVVLKDLENSDELQYTLLNATFASLLEDGISDESPVGRALLGKKVGDLIEIAIPAGSVHFEIIGLRY